MAEASLYEYQTNHVNTILKHLKENNIFIDSSAAGLGKTYTTNKIAKELNLPMLIICPLVLGKMWIEIGEQFKNKIIGIYCYNDLENISNGSTKIEEKEYLLVFDEFQNLISDDERITDLFGTNYTYHAQKLISYSLENNSKVALLSNMFMDKPEQSLNVLRVLNVSKDYDPLYIVHRSIDGMPEIEANKNNTDQQKIEFFYSHAFKLLKTVFFPQYLFKMDTNNNKLLNDVKPTDSISTDRKKALDTIANAFIDSISSGNKDFKEKYFSTINSYNKFLDESNALILSEGI